MIQSQFTQKHLIDFTKHQKDIVQALSQVYTDGDNEFAQALSEQLNEILDKTYVLFKGEDVALDSACRTSPQFDEFAWDASAFNQEPRVYYKAIKKALSLQEQMEQCKEHNENFLTAMQKFCLEHPDCRFLSDEKIEIFKLTLQLGKPELVIPTIKAVIEALCFALCPNIISKYHLSSKKDLTEEMLARFSLETIANEKVNSSFKPGEKQPLYKELILFMQENLNLLALMKEPSEVEKDSLSISPLFSNRGFNSEITNFSIKQEQNNSFFVLKDGKWVERAVSYNIDNMSDNVLLHELDHSIMSGQTWKFNGKVLDKPLIYKGFAKYECENGQPAGENLITNLLIDEANKTPEGKKALDLFKETDKKGRSIPLYSSVNSALSLFEEVLTDYRALQATRILKEKGIVMFDENEKVSSYSRAFQGCDNLFTQLLPYITTNTLFGCPEDVIHKIGVANFLQIIHSVTALSKVDLKNCASDLASLYYNCQSGAIDLIDRDRDLTEDEKVYLDHTQKINTALDDAVYSLDKDNVLFNLWG